MTQIVVDSLGPREFRVRVRAGGLETTHHVMIPEGFESDHRLPSSPLETVVERSFEFLLEREPASSILTRFSLGEISRYFPEYADEIARRLS